MILKIVSFVLVTELTLHLVVVQLIILTLTKNVVHHVQMLVKNVIMMETVLFVLLTENQFLNVHVLNIISKLSFKIDFSAKFVMLDVMTVITFSTCVTLVWLIL